MRKLFIFIVLAAGLATGRAALTETFSFSGINRAVPDGNPAGMIDGRTISSAITSISSITVGLNISGGYNGDLYITLQHSSGFSVLLNRTGKTVGDAYGYGDSGFNIRFDDAAANDVHNYQASTMPGAGLPLTGTWQPDARNIDPADVTSASTRSAYLSSFQGLSAGGTWTLFVADTVSGGGTPTLNSWDLEITGVPEPTTIALGIFGGLAGGLWGFASLRRKFCSKQLP